MADVKQCDRCRKIYTYKEKLFEFRNKRLTKIELWNYCDSRIAVFDLCDECCGKLIKFLESEE